MQRLNRYYRRSQIAEPKFRLLVRHFEQIQKFLGHSKIETTQIYAESSTEMMKEGFKKAFSG